MSENAEIGYVISAGIEGTAMLIKGSVVAVQALMKLMQWMAKRVKTGHLKPREYRDLQRFIQQSKGNIRKWSRRGSRIIVRSAWKKGILNSRRL